MKPAILEWLKKKNPWIVLIIILIVIYIIFKLTDTTPTHKGVPVEVAKVVSGSISPTIDVIGHIAADNSVDIKSQIDGQLVKIPANPGQEVKQGDLLFVIDPRPYQAKLDEAQADLAKDIASQEIARKNLERYQKLIAKGYVSKEYYDQTVSTYDSAKATVAAAKAAIETAQIQLGYTQITAPMSGRLSDVNPSVGDLTHASDTTPLTTIIQFKPIDATFSIPGQNLPAVVAANQRAPLQVIATPDSDKAYKATGTLYFINNKIDKDTGTITMKASFPNNDERLWPGQFVKIHIEMPQIPNSVLVPTISLQQDQQQKYYVFVVDKQHIAHMRTVEVGITQNETSSIDSGLKPGELVVTKGQFEIADGSLVNPKKAN